MRLGGVRRVAAASLIAPALASGGTAAAGLESAHERGAAAASGGGEEFAGLVELPSGREVYLECRGEGSPTVILESGGGLAASHGAFWRRTRR